MLNTLLKNLVTFVEQIDNRTVMILFPNAKINLGLDILRKRSDGYHDIETVMYPVAWCDILEIVPSKGAETTLTITGREVNCPVEKNLVMKAYRALDEVVELPPVDIYLRKIIPDGAGLGGGSADAAFTLRGLNELFQLGYRDHELAEIASQIGADCPFFIYNRPMLCTEIGTVMTPFDISLSGKTIVIVKPEVSVPTAKAYSQTHPTIPDRSVTDILQMPMEKWQGRLKNDFEPSVLPEYPAIAKVKERLMDIGAVYSAMSGSGSTVYGIFEYDILSEGMSNEFEGSQVFISKL